MESVLITGGIGFLGRRLAETLVAKGVDVTVADVVPPPRHEKNPRFVRCDLTDFRQLGKLPADASVVYHLAAYSSPAKCQQNPGLAFKMNVHATYNLLRHCVSGSVRKFIFPSAAHLYGDEPEYLPIDEAHPIDLVSHVYNATKKIGEDMCRAFYENHGLKYVVFRLFNTYGPGQSTDFFVPSIIKQALSRHRITIRSGRPSRDFIFVDDVIDAFVRAGERRYSGGPLNLGTGVETPVSEVARIIAERTKAELVIGDGAVYGPIRSRCNNTVAKGVLGWTPKTSLRTGLSKTIDWYLKNAAKGR